MVCGDELEAGIINHQMLYDVIGFLLLLSKLQRRALKDMFMKSTCTWPRDRYLQSVSRLQVSAGNHFSHNRNMSE